MLVLFALMLTRAPIGPNAEIDTPAAGSGSPAPCSARRDDRAARVAPPPALRGRAADLDASTTTTPQVAQAVFGTWVWPFELLSVLLLVALIGAFAVSRLVLQPTGDRGTHRPATDRVGRERSAPMIHLSAPGRPRGLLAGIGVYGVLARRNAVLVLIGVELILNAANLLLVTAGAARARRSQAGQC